MQNPAHEFRHLQACLMVATCDCESVLELGCGVGDKLAACSSPGFRHGVDIHLPYLKRARARWGSRLHLDHQDALEFAIEAVANKRAGGRLLWDAVLLIDFIEHLVRPAGRRLLRLCKELARHRIVVCCPEGFRPQVGDAYSLGGEEWQRHRSAWWASDFEQRGFDVARWEDRHGPGQHALFAIWNQP